MTRTDKTEHFVQQLATHQNRLYGYVYSLLGDHSRAADVLQETNIVLWRKIDEFQTDKSFLPWAFAIARFQVLAHLRDHNRDRLLLDAELAELKARGNQIRTKAQELSKDKSLSRQQRDAALAKFRAELYSPKELEILKGSSNAEYHYNGSAKIMAQIGKGFAEALQKMNLPAR